MKKATWIKILCLAIVCALLIPMVIACGGDTTTDDTKSSETTGSSAADKPSTESSNNGGNTDGGNTGTTEKVTIQFRANGKDAEFDGADSVQVNKGGKLDVTMTPSVYRDGYVFDRWAYDTKGDNAWNAGDIFNENTVLYAIWVAESTGGNGGNTDGGNGGNTDGGNTGVVEKITVQFRGNGKGTEFEGNTSVEINKGGKLDVTMTPSVYRDGYTFEYWAYDTTGDNAWNAGDIFNENTILYATWTAESTGGNGGNTDGGNGGNTDGGNGGNDQPIVSGDIVVEFNTGTGYFTDTTLYEVSLKKGGRLSSFPTPVHDNKAMLFDGWYKDSACTTPASLSDKYEDNTMLYALWIEQAECTDGSYNHFYSGWDVDQKADCVKPGTYARYCDYCNDKQIKVGDPALGHQFGQWQEAFMARQRTCQRLGCGEIEIENFKNVTVAVLGSAPAEQITGSTTNFYVVPFTNLINNRWDEGHGEFVGPKGNGTAYVQFNMLEPTTLDRIYFKGEGVTSINVYVQYEGEDDFTLVGICGGCSDKEDTPFVEPDSTKNIISIKFVEDNPPNGTSKWQEVAFVKVEE